MLAVSVCALCWSSMYGQTVICSIAFNGPEQVVALDDSARGCLNRAAAQYKDHPGSHLALTGPVAARVNAGREYLIHNDSLPPAAVIVSTAPGNIRFVQVALVPAPKTEVFGGGAVGAILGGMLGNAVGERAGASAGGTHGHEALPPKQRSHLETGEAIAPTQPSQPQRTDVSPAQPEGTGSGPNPKQPPSRVAPPPIPEAHNDTDPYAEGRKIQEWEKQLRSGGIDFNPNPGPLVVGRATGIIVVVHGPYDKTHSDLPGVQQEGVLPKVGDHMRVDLEAPLAPGEFTITPQPGPILPVPLDGYATWEFQVTPNHQTSDAQTLVIRPYLIPPHELGAQPLPERNFTVQVKVESFWKHLHDLWKEDPIKVAKYLLPGGQGFTGMGAFITGLIALLTSLGIIAWIKRKIDARGKSSKDSAKPSDETGQ